MVSITPDTSTQTGMLLSPEERLHRDSPQLTGGIPNARQCFPSIAEFKQQQTNTPNPTTAQISSPIPPKIVFRMRAPFQ